MLKTKIYNFITNKPYSYVFIVFLIAGYLISIISANIMHLLNIKSGYQQEPNIIFQFINALILGPLVETFFFQYIIINLLMSTTIKRIYILSISSICFGVLHGIYSVSYLISALFFGFLLSTCYMVFHKHEQYPFLTTFFLHALVNFLGVIKYL